MEKQLTPAEAVTHITSQLGNPAKFIRKGRGYVDWKFGEVCEYLGYQGATSYVQSMRSWWDYTTKYQQRCLLDQTYEAFLQAQQQLNNENHN